MTRPKETLDEDNGPSAELRRFLMVRDDARETVLRELADFLTSETEDERSSLEVRVASALGLSKEDISDYFAVLSVLVSLVMREHASASDDELAEYVTQLVGAPTEPSPAVYEICRTLRRLIVLSTQEIHQIYVRGLHPFLIEAAATVELRALPSLRYFFFEDDSRDKTRFAGLVPIATIQLTTDVESVGPFLVQVDEVALKMLIASLNVTLDDIRTLADAYSTLSIAHRDEDEI